MTILDAHVMCTFLCLLDTFGGWTAQIDEKIVSCLMFNGICEDEKKSFTIIKNSQ